MALFLLPLLAVPTLLPPALEPAPSAAPLPEAPLEDPLAPVREQKARAEDLLYGVLGQRLDAEDVEIHLEVDVVNVEFSPVGILLGGGKVQGDIRVTGRFEFAALHLRRITDMINESRLLSNGSVIDNATLSGIVDGLPLQVIHAEVFRNLGGGVLLDAFTIAQEKVARRLIEDSLPGLTTISVDFDWLNVEPRPDELGAGLGLLAPRHTPIVLQFRLDLRYLETQAASDVIVQWARDAFARGNGSAESEEDLIKRSLRENQTLPWHERSAFDLAGIDQLVAVPMPPGWRLNLTVTVPRGVTIEGATNELAVSRDRRTATYVHDGSEQRTHRESASVVTVSSRPFVVLALFTGMLLVGLLARLPAEGLMRWLRARLRASGTREWSRRPWADALRREERPHRVPVLVVGEDDVAGVSAEPPPRAPP